MSCVLMRLVLLVILLRVVMVDRFMIYCWASIYQQTCKVQTRSRAPAKDAFGVANKLHKTAKMIHHQHHAVHGIRQTRMGSAHHDYE